MKKQVFVATAALGAFLTAGLAQAGPMVNGTNLNGVHLNGLTQNGQTWNGTNLNGRRINGLALNGSIWNGVITRYGPTERDTAAVLPRIEPSELGGFVVEAVELPDGTVLTR